ncbi:uncharacterized protein LOC122798352 [Protopterus annectens]|uniref:uncharacterized protein LOC122798352 n=1 Tax=Protopterus annectens TaxID=7888 RepID=UPI001CFABBB1|nr:uncharacterized protein LOC122798352 [Protopterus annectens]
MAANEKENTRQRQTAAPVNVPDTSSQPENMKTSPVGIHNYDEDLSKSVSRSKLRVSWPPPKISHENVSNLPTGTEITQVKSGQRSPISPVETNRIGLLDVNAATSSSQKHKFTSEHYKMESSSDAFADSQVQSIGSNSDSWLKAGGKADLNIGAQELKLSFAGHSKADEPKQPSISERIAMFQDISSSKSTLQHNTKATSPASARLPSVNTSMPMPHNVPSSSSSEAFDDPAMHPIPCSITANSNNSHDTQGMKSTDQREMGTITDSLGDNESKEGEAAASHEDNISDRNISNDSEENVNNESNAEQGNADEENTAVALPEVFGLFDCFDDTVDADPRSHYQNYDAPCDNMRNYPHVDVINQNNYNTMKSETFSQVPDTKKPLYIRTQTEEETYRYDSGDEQTPRSEPQEPVSVTFSNMLEGSSDAEFIISGFHDESSDTAVNNQNDPTVNEPQHGNIAGGILDSTEVVPSDTMDLSHKNTMAGENSEVSVNTVNICRSSMSDVPEESDSQTHASDMLSKSDNHEFDNNSSLKNASNLKNTVLEPDNGHCSKTQSHDGGVTMQPQHENSTSVTCEKDSVSLSQEMPLKNILPNVQNQGNGLSGSDCAVRSKSLNHQGVLADETKQEQARTKQESSDKDEFCKEEQKGMPASEIKMSELLDPECDAAQKQSNENDLQGKIHTDGQNNELSEDSSISKNETQISGVPENIAQTKENKKSHARKESLTKSPGLGRNALSKLFTAGSKDATPPKEQSEKKKPSPSKSSSAFGKLFRSSSEKGKEEMKQSENLAKANKQRDIMQPEEAEDDSLCKVNPLSEMPAPIPVNSEAHVYGNGKHTVQEAMEVQGPQQNNQLSTNSDLLEDIKSQNVEAANKILDPSKPLTIHTDNTEECSKINSHNRISDSHNQIQMSSDTLNQEQNISQPVDNMLVISKENSQSAFNTSDHVSVSLVYFNAASISSGNGNELTHQSLSLGTTAKSDISNELFSDFSDHCKQQDTLVQSVDNASHILAGSVQETVSFTEQIAIPSFTDDPFGLLSTTPLNQTPAKDSETIQFAILPGENMTKMSSDDIFDILHVDVPADSQVQTNAWHSHDITKQQFSTGFISSSSSDDPFGNDNLFFDVAGSEMKQSSFPSSSVNNDFFDSFFDPSMIAPTSQHAQLLQSDPFVMDAGTTVSISVPEHNVRSQANELDDLFNPLSANSSNTIGNAESNTDLLSDFLS